MPLEKVSLADKFARFSDYWNPRIVAGLNGQQLKVVKVRGEFVWHQHDREDELFLVVRGRLRIELEHEAAVTLDEGEMVVVPAGVRHRPVAEAEAHVLVFEPAGVVNTGEVQNDLTRRQIDWI
jgi:mannose-6-phosphate isomerase-like protein (cupin superfamily)